MTTELLIIEIEKIIDYLERSNCPPFIQFPYGSCRGASKIFGERLSSAYPDCNIFGRLLNATLESENDVSHFWLNVDGFIVDLTIKQFGYHDKYFVGNSEEVILDYFMKYYGISKLDFLPVDVIDFF